MFATSIWRGAGEWAFDFYVPVPPATLQLPAGVEPVRSDGLTARTCFSLFLHDTTANGSYLEFDFSPSGEWAAWHFDGYRAGRRALEVEPPTVLTSDRNQMALAFAARLRRRGGLDEEFIARISNFSRLPEPPIFNLRAEFEDARLRGNTIWRAGLAAVIVEADGTRSSWAMAHTREEPDAHDPASFVLDLGRPRRAARKQSVKKPAKKSTARKSSRGKSKGRKK